MTIPKSEWWCGCDPNRPYDFKSEKEFVKHMEKDHASTWPLIRRNILEKKVHD